MNFIEWSRTYSVGMDEIDHQHQKLFEMINAFGNKSCQANHKAFKNLLIDLNEYAVDHFRTEEKYFKEFNYPHSNAHIMEHQKFEEKISEFRSGYQLHKTFNSTVILDFLKEWIINHILINDKKYMKCFHDNGLR